MREYEVTAQLIAGAGVPAIRDTFLADDADDAIRLAQARMREMRLYSHGGIYSPPARAEERRARWQRQRTSATRG